MIPPVPINKRDLKKAWQIIWKKHNFKNPNETKKKSIPNWLKVDMATTFLKSISKFAKPPPNNIVIREIIIRKFLISLIKLKNPNRIDKYTPAVTKVEEWTKEEIGVGADMAEGNQAEKGNWALFVKKEDNKKIKPNLEKENISRLNPPTKFK